MSEIPKKPTITKSELQKALASVDSRVLLVPSRLLRRIISSDRDVGGFFASVPHQKGYIIGHERLLDIVAPAELGLRSADEVPETAVLLPEPILFELTSRPGDTVLCEYWRLLFHLRLHESYDEVLDKANRSTVRERIHRIGRSAFDEIAAVLRQENTLLPPRTDRGTYVEFAAVYWELRYFAPTSLTRFFPTLSSMDGIEEMLRQDVNVGTLFSATRLPGAAKPESVYVDVHENGAPTFKPNEPLPHAPVSESRYRRMEKRATPASAVGNQVRAAVWWMRAAQVANSEQRTEALAHAREELIRLADRLQQALQLPSQDYETLRETLPELLEESAHNGWPVERRFLYDLQKICIYHEQSIYALHPFRWLFSLGKKPLKESMPLQRQVLVTKYLRAALHRLAIVRIASAERKRLSEILKNVVQSSEKELRSDLRPVFQTALNQVGFVPDDHPERVARDKIVEEWLDVLCERGQLSMGDIRDGLSRNQIKMNDLAGPGELLWGDELLRLDRVLAEKLKGVYRTGEFYLRWMQRFSSVAFGTPLGRFLTRYLALPFGGAFVVLFFAFEVSERVAHLFGGHVENFVTFPRVLAVGTLTLALIYIGDFRRQLARGIVYVWGWTRWVFFDIPYAFFKLPWIYNFFHSWLMLQFYRYVFWPLLFGASVWGALVILGMSGPSAITSGIGVFVVALLLLNSLYWRRLKDRFASWSSRHWMRFRTNILPGLVRLIIDFFRWLLDLLNRALYAMDELFRFRQGQSLVALALKSMFGVVWAAVAYVVRFCVVLLIEPQINPIKHFPVVTVSHKLIMPFAFVLGPMLAENFPDTFDQASGTFWAGVFLSGIPGIFGFLVWELKENWRLYRANRPVYLPKVAIGHHGESMMRLLRPGFHSGTIPKLLTKRRRAEQKARENGDWRTVHKYEESLHHCEESIRRFLERELVHLLNTSSQWKQKVHVGRIDMAFLSVSFELHCCELSEEPIRVSLEEQSRWLVARIYQHGWLVGLSKKDAQVVQKALAGIYQMAGVRLIRGQIETVLPADKYSLDVTRTGFIVWRNDVEAEAFYEYRHGPKLKPTVTIGRREQFPLLTKRSLVFSENYLTWLEWVDMWELDHGVKEIELSHVESGRW